jgi:transcriptional regulator with XRE-family HTH domain
MDLGEKLKFARKVTGLSLREVSRKTGISNPYLSQLENGQILEPSFTRMMILIRFYNLDVDDFIDREVMLSEGEKTIARLSNDLSGDASDKNTRMQKCATCGKSYLKGMMCPQCFGEKWIPR